MRDCPSAPAVERPSETVRLCGTSKGMEHCDAMCCHDELYPNMSVCQYMHLEAAPWLLRCEQERPFWLGPPVHAGHYGGDIVSDQTSAPIVSCLLLSDISTPDEGCMVFHIPTTPPL